MQPKLHKMCNVYLYHWLYLRQISSTLKCIAMYAQPTTITAIDMDTKADTPTSEAMNISGAANI